MNNLYQWEQSVSQKWGGLANNYLSILLLLSAAVIIGIALFSHNKTFKALTLAYIILP